MPHRASSRLSRIVAGQMILVTVVLMLCLVGFFATRYLLDVPELRRATLEGESKAIVAALESGMDPTREPHFLNYPHSYGFRVFDRRDPERRRLLVAINSELLAASHGNSEAEPRDNAILDEGIEVVRDVEAGAARTRWILTDRDQVGGRTYWIQTVMVDDPAWRWRTVIGQELFDHVLLPVSFIVPALTLAMILTMRRALVPLARIAAQAGELGTAVAAGRALTALPSADLPREFYEVVAALNVMLAKLERARMLQRQFTSDAAHELRTPLSILLLEVSELPASEARGRITSELQALTELLNQLLRFAQAEAAMTTTLDPVDVTGCARRVCVDLAPIAVAGGTSIEFAASSRSIVRGNAALLDAAVRNILSNAISVSPRGSTVSVSVDAHTRVLIEDRGPGVPDADKKRIFDRLWRAEHRRHGTGIGLALVRRIAQLHGGEVWVEDREGGGARFVLALAAAK